MAKLDNSSTTPWNKTLTINKQSGAKVTLETATKYVEENIELTFNVKKGTLGFSGGALSGTATASVSNASISESTNNSGVQITTACTATRENVVYNNITNGWVAPTNGGTAYSGDSAPLTSKKYYINGVTLTEGKSFSITVPNGSNGTITFNFTVDSNGNTTIT